MNTSKHRVVVVEDEPKIRRNIAQKIERSEEYEIVGTASDGMEAVKVIFEQKPDVVFTDIKMPKMSGLELVQQIKEALPETHFVIISGYNEFDYAQTAMKLGVRDYLLKPVNVEALNECLKNISESLLMRNQRMRRELLTSSMNGGLEETNSRVVNPNQPFAIFLICIGNLCASIVPPDQFSYFRELWKDVSLESVMRHAVGPDEYWVVVDEKAPNQKFLLVSADQNREEDLHVMAKQIQASVADRTGGLPTHIGHLDSFVTRADIWEQAQNVRRLMEQELVPCRSSLLFAPREQEIQSATHLLDQVLRNKVSAFIQAGQTNSLKSEVFQAFDQWEKAGYTQRMLEKVTMHLIRSIHLQTGALSEAELFTKEIELFAKLTVCRELSSFYIKVWELVEKMVLIEEEDQDTLKLVEQVANYLELNYTQDISLEELATKFHFTSSYLSKMFKKKYNGTPLKYMIKLRIEEAKRLIRENPQSEVGRIATIVGYPDQHYFSRIFKNATGMSPSEYRDRQV